MRSTLRTVRPAWLVVIVVVAGAAGWIATEVSNRIHVSTPVLPYSSLVTMGLIVVMTLALGIRVRSWRNGNRRRELNPILAARTVVLAQACAYAGALLFGWHAGIMVYDLPTLGMRSNLDIIWQILTLAGGGAFMVVVGLVVERFCKLPPEDTDALKGHDPREKREGHGEEEFA